MGVAQHRIAAAPEQALDALPQDRGAQMATCIGLATLGPP